MNKEKLKKHIKLCRRNLKSVRVKCCTNCPFEKEIVEEYPDLIILFEKKQEYYADSIV